MIRQAAHIAQHGAGAAARRDLASSLAIHRARTTFDQRRCGRARRRGQQRLRAKRGERGRRWRGNGRGEEGGGAERVRQDALGRGGVRVRGVRMVVVVRG